VSTARERYTYIILFVGLLLVVAGRLIGLAYIYIAKVDMERISAYEALPGVGAEKGTGYFSEDE
jgi:hypothetical protein